MLGLDGGPLVPGREGVTATRSRARLSHTVARDLSVVLTRASTHGVTKKGQPRRQSARFQCSEKDNCAPFECFCSALNTQERASARHCRVLNASCTCSSRLGGEGKPAWNSAPFTLPREDSLGLCLCMPRADAGSASLSGRGKGRLAGALGNSQSTRHLARLSGRLSRCDL